MSKIFEHSLIIPIYGNEDNIKPLINAINNIIEQVSPNFEVVFVIDGSPDKSYERLLEMKKCCRFSYQIINLSRNFG
ncbi:glycosyltransferase, partial [Vibrio cholerae]